MPLALILPRGDVCVCVCACVCAYRVTRRRAQRTNRSSSPPLGHCQVVEHFKSRVRVQSVESETPLAFVHRLQQVTALERKPLKFTYSRLNSLLRCALFSTHVFRRRGGGASGPVAWHRVFVPVKGSNQDEKAASHTHTPNSGNIFLFYILPQAPPVGIRPRVASGKKREKGSHDPLPPPPN